MEHKINKHLAPAVLITTCKRRCSSLAQKHSVFARTGEVVINVDFNMTAVPLNVSLNAAQSHWIPISRP